MTENQDPYAGVYLINRCRKCQRLLTKLEIIHYLKEQIPQLCPCGSRTITPSNVTPEEYDELGGDEQEARWNAGIDDHKTRLWKLWDAYQRGEVTQPANVEVEKAESPKVDYGELTDVDTEFVYEEEADE